LNEELLPFVLLVLYCPNPSNADRNLPVDFASSQLAFAVTSRAKTEPEEALKSKE
jgi:hypothetical protein